MGALVLTNSKGQDVTTSPIVAKIFGRNHADVLRDIRNLHCSDEFRLRNFAEMFINSDLPNGGSRQDPYYEMTKDGFSFLVMGYTGERAAQFKETFINEFNKRDSLLKSDDYILSRALEISHNRMRALEAANETLVRDVVQLGAKTLEQEKALEAAAPKVLFADTVTASADSILIGELAKIICQKGIEIGEKRLFAWMRNNGYLCSRPGEYYNRPAQRYIEQGLFEIKKGSVLHSNGTVLVTTTPMVTGKGQLYFVNKFLYQMK